MKPENKRIILAAEGYHDLDLIDEAWDELRSLPASEHEHPLYVQMCVLLYLKEKRWDEALDASKRLTDLLPEASAGFIHAAYCLHEMGHTPEARQLLLDGPPALKEEATYYYNLGCYQAQLGDLDDAKRLVKRSFELDQRLVEVAKKDDDLKALWADL